MKINPHEHERLMRENEYLKEQLSYYRCVFRRTLMISEEIKLEPQEEKFLLALFELECPNREQIYEFMDNSRAFKNEPEMKILDVCVCKLRPILKPFGINIHTKWGHGYFLTPEDKAKLKPYIIGGAR